MDKKSIDEVVGEIFSKESFLEGYEITRQWRGKRVLKFLKKQEIDPFVLSNPKMFYLTFLGLASYIKGAVGINKKRKYAGSIHKEGINEYNLELLRNELKILLEPKKRLKQENESKILLDSKEDMIPFGVNGASYCRVLSEFGFNIIDINNTPIITETPIGTEKSKAKTGSKFPEYLEKTIDNYQNISIEDKDLADKYLRLIVSTYFSSKFRDRIESMTYRLDLIDQPTEEFAKYQGEKIIKAINLVCPNSNVSNNQLSVNSYRKNSSIVTGYITFKKFQVETFKQYRLPLKSNMNNDFKVDILFSQ